LLSDLNHCNGGYLLGWLPSQETFLLNFIVEKGMKGRIAAGFEVHLLVYQLTE